jgi:hypothetical protein
MNTFLPLPSFTDSAKALDRQRLGNQRLEALLLVQGKWYNHPASRMWHGHFYQLAAYGMAICQEWIARGYRDNCLPKFQQEQRLFKNTRMPKWLGDPDFHRAHQSNLIRKLRAHYAPLFPGVPDNLPYIWPSNEIGRV